ncbi:MAG: hypothetical protein GF411_06330 [Candidatus Lokiarchaeota archaeon]|nr:hypothetical protein [Candidatus Lokiarchaeota archaeon]
MSDTDTKRDRLLIDLWAKSGEAVETEDLEKAEKILLEAFEVYGDERDAITPIYLADIYLMRRELNKAQNYYELSIRRLNIYPDAWYGLALVQERKGKSRDAFKSKKRGKELLLLFPECGERPFEQPKV